MYIYIYTLPEAKFIARNVPVERFSRGRPGLEGCCGRYDTEFDRLDEKSVED